MSWREIYQQRKMTAEEALLKIKENQRVVVGHACGEPSYLLEEMVKRKEFYRNVEIVHMIAMGQGAYCRPEMAGHFRHNSLFVGASTRKAVEEGRADFTPVHFSEIPGLFRSALPVDAALIMVTPPNEEGRVSLGISVDYTKAAAKCAGLVIAQVNDRMPFTEGESTLDVSEIDCFVEHSAPLIELEPAKIGEVEKKIGEYCASLIRDGDTLQMGIGGIPDAVLASLKGKKDIGIHSEMFSDGVVELARSGVVTGARKRLHPGKMVATFLMGTKKLYDFVDHNPDIWMAPVDYVNHPSVIAENERMVCINSCVQIDMTGQVAAESVGYRQISAVGGQVDFVRGAAMAGQGISIMAMSSTAAGGKISKIVPLLDEGAAVTTSRADVDCVVTEYGIAHLKGKTLRQRAEALIKIAHPTYREGLIKEYEKRFHRTYPREKNL